MPKWGRFGFCVVQGGSLLFHSYHKRESKQHNILLVARALVKKKCTTCLNLSEVFLFLDMFVRARPRSERGNPL